MHNTSIYFQQKRTRRALRFGIFSVIVSDTSGYVIKGYRKKHDLCNGLKIRTNPMSLRRRGCLLIFHFAFASPARPAVSLSC